MERHAYHLVNPHSIVNISSLFADMNFRQNTERRHTWLPEHR
jgi:hypothetical protein